MVDAKWQKIMLRIILKLGFLVPLVSHATGRPGYHFVILESSLRTAHSDAMNWLRQIYKRTVQASENRHLLSKIDKLVEKMNEIAEARSFVCICKVLAVSIQFNQWSHLAGRGLVQSHRDPRPSLASCAICECWFTWWRVLLHPGRLPGSIFWILILSLLVSMSLLRFFFRWWDHVSVERSFLHTRVKHGNFFNLSDVICHTGIVGPIHPFRNKDTFNNNTELDLNGCQPPLLVVVLLVLSCNDMLEQKLQCTFFDYSVQVLVKKEQENGSTTFHIAVFSHSSCFHCSVFFDNCCFPM